MRKKFCVILISLISVLCLTLALSACVGKVEFKVSFVVDGQTVYTINTNGDEVITMPSNPQKDDYIFDGWYWDKDVWEKPFTANSLLDAPLSSDINVYCKWRPAHEHTFTKEVVEETYKASGASCTVKAKYYYSCECGAKGTETFEHGELLPHTEEIIIGKDATCTESGLTDGKKCSVCGEILQAQETIPAKEHMEKIITGKLATCTENGLTEGKECSICGKITAKQTIIPAIGHKFDNGICLSCDAEQSPATISKVEGGTIDDLDIYMFVEHDVTEVNLLRIVTCSPKSTWKLYEDKRGQHEIATKIASGENDELSNGNNVFYIVATSANGIDVNTYTLTIYRSFEISINYYDGETILKTDKAFTGHEYSTDYAPEIVGYTFNCWKNGDETFANAVLWDNLVLSADKTARTFTVSFVTDSNAQAIQSLIATYDQEVTLPTSGKTGYTFNGWLDGSEISENTFVWNFIEDKEYTAKFTATEYTITYELSGGTLITEVNDYDIERAVNFDNPNRIGYEFAGWYDNAEFSGAAVDGIAVGNYGDKTFYAKWESELIYTLSSNSEYYVVEGDRGSHTNIVILSVFNDKPVKAIAAHAFENCGSLISVKISDSVMTIGERAFKNCSSLLNVYFMGDIESWCNISFDDRFANPMYSGANLYIDNELVTELIIPDTVTKIDNAFCGCTSLTSVVIPSNATTIGMDAFFNCSNLKSVVIPIGVIAIDEWAFAVCSSLTSIIIPDGVTTIGTDAFFLCSSLTSVVIPSSVTTIDEWAFSRCSSLASVYYTGDMESWCNISFGNYYANPLYDGANLYINNELVTEIVIPDTVTEIKPYAFYACTGITSITIPDNVTSIGSYAFYNCSSLTNITIPDSVTSIGEAAFVDCSNITSVYYTGDIVGWCNISFDVVANPLYDGANLYINNELVTENVIPDTVTEIKPYAFYACKSMTSVTIPNSVTSIGEAAFVNCSNITSVYYTGDIAGWCNISFGFAANPLNNAHNLYIDNEIVTELVIPDTVTEIKDYAFDCCLSLTSVVIPDSVTAIGSYAFYNCRNLTSVYYKGTADDWAGISIGSSNDYLINVTRYYYSEAEPTTSGSYWHYDTDGITPTKWG